MEGVSSEVLLLLPPFASIAAIHFSMDEKRCIDNHKPAISETIGYCENSGMSEVTCLDCYGGFKSINDYSVINYHGSVTEALRPNFFVCGVNICICVEGGGA